MSPTNASPSTQGSRFKYLLAVLLVILILLTALALRQQTIMTQNLLPSPSVQQSLFELSTYDDEADLIIRRSYEQSYAHILKCTKSSWKAMNDAVAIECMEQTRDHIMSKEGPSVPWWFQTLLRDILSGGTGVYAPWHHFYTSKPPFHFCTMGKVATTEWRKVFCKLNAQDCVDDSSVCGKRNCTWKTTQKMPANAPWAVFVRDPLERLLSGYLDKCYNSMTRRNQRHCQPNVVFNPAAGLVDRKNRSYADLLEDLIDIEGKEKAMFGAYVDVLPLKWNVHFIPQALFCDLHRNIDKYDFVGNMGKDFYFDLDRMANQFGGQLPTILNSTFGYMDHVANDNHENTGKEGSGHAMHTPEKVAKFYTARTVRKALEYLSIDYVTLGLEVPDWARQMLREESAMTTTS